MRNEALQSKREDNTSMRCEYAQEEQGETKQRHMAAAQAAHKGRQVQKLRTDATHWGQAKRSISGQADALGLRAQSAALERAWRESG